MAEGIFNRSGKAFVIEEKSMGACMALASCGIAYFLRFIRAAAEGSVELGLRPTFATQIAALTAEGAAALLADGAHPEAEIDKVTTPGGITIKGLNALEGKRIHECCHRGSACILCEIGLLRLLRRLRSLRSLIKK